MKKRIELLTYFVCLLVFASSCQKENVQKAVSLDSEKKDIVIEHGMLSFRSHSVFMNKMKELNALTLAEVNQIVDAFDFRSYALDTLIDREIEVNPDPLLRRVLNHDASIKVGDSIFVFMPDKEIVIKNGDIDVYQEVLLGKIDEGNPYVQVNKVNISTAQFDLADDGVIAPLSKSPGTWYGETQIFSPEEHYGRPERVKIVVFAQSSGLYPSAGATARGEAYRRGGVFGKKKWHDDEMHMLTFTLHLATDNFGQTSSNLPPATDYEQQEIKLITSIAGPHPVTGEFMGWKQLDFSLQFRKSSNVASPLRTMRYKIVNGVEQPLVKNW